MKARTRGTSFMSGRQTVNTTDGISGRSKHISMSGSWLATRCGSGATPTRLVLFRRPIEHRAESRADLEALLLTIVVEQVAELLGLDPERVDPRYEGE